MTQTDLIAWRQATQAKLMAALDAAWALLERTTDPDDIRRIRDRAKAIGDLAAMARKVVMLSPPDPPADPDVTATHVAPKAERPARTVAPAAEAPAIAPVSAQAEITRRALDKLKGGGRARL